MSDILIKNMKMPIGCDGWGTSCPLLQWGLGDVYCRITHRHFDSIEDSFKYAKERPPDCPLIEVPSADVAEVVRCKDCRFHTTDPECFDEFEITDKPMMCVGIRYGGVDPDWFCEHGERMDGGR